MTDKKTRKVMRESYRILYNSNFENKIYKFLKIYLIRIDSIRNEEVE